jgi:hypothetical protein
MEPNNSANRLALTPLAHHIRTRKGGAKGGDGQSAEQYAQRLEENLQSLCDRAKSGMYRAPQVRWVHIPKGDGSHTQPNGIPTFVPSFSLLHAALACPTPPRRPIRSRASARASATH